MEVGTGQKPEDASPMRLTEMDSFIEIELYQDTPFVSGTPLYGTVHLHAQDNILDVKQVSITLNGEEQVVLHLPDKSQGGGIKPVNKIHPVVNDKHILMDYAQYQNVILQGSFSYPFTLNLPEWLPQSHLCFNTPDAKKPHILNTFKIRYNLIAAIESTTGTIIQCEKKGPTVNEMANMICKRRLTIITPEFGAPLINQEITKSSKIKSMMLSSGQCSYTCKFEKDVLYPNEMVKLKVDIDNSKCTKKIEKYKIKLLRRTQVFNLKTRDPIYTNDFMLVSEKLPANCDAKGSDEMKYEFQIPTSIFVSSEEEKRFKVPLLEKPLAQGPSSSLSGRLYKVQYVLQFALKHNIVGAKQKTMPEAQIPLVIMTPSKSCIVSEKPKIQSHPNWQPYAFDCLEFTTTPEQEKANEYADYRKWLINKEREFVQEQQKQLGQQAEANPNNQNGQEEVKVGDENYGDDQQQQYDQQQDQQHDQQQYYDYGQENYNQGDGNYDQNGYYDDQGNYVNYDQNYNNQDQNYNNGEQNEQYHNYDGEQIQQQFGDMQLETEQDYQQNDNYGNYNGEGAYDYGQENAGYEDNNLLKWK